MHSAEHLGLQEHSVGTEYPWSVVIYKNPNQSVGSCRPEQLVNGTKGPNFVFKDFNESFNWAHRQAERWIEREKALGASSVSDSREILSTLGYPSFVDNPGAFI